MIQNIRVYEEADRPHVYRLLNQTNNTPLGEEMFDIQEVRTKSFSFFVRIVGVDADGRIVGMAQAAHVTGQTPVGCLSVGVVVDEVLRGKGYGSLLGEALQSRIDGQKVRGLHATIRDNDPISREWAEKRGYALHAHQFESVIDLGTFPFDTAEAEIGVVRAKGITFCTAVEFPLEPNMAHYYEALNQMSRDTPDAQGALDIPYDMFVNMASRMDPASIFLAMSGSEIVGVTVLVPQGDEMYTFFTGTARDYRGRGIARALKLQSFLYAREKGVMKLRTNNRSNNAPMLAINRKLGYVSEPGRWILEKQL